MRPSTGATICIVAELMYMDSSLGGGIIALDLVGNRCRGIFKLLFEIDGPADGGIATKNCNYCREERGT